MDKKNIEEALGIIWHMREQGIRNKDKIYQEMLKGFPDHFHNLPKSILDDLIKESLIRDEKGSIEFNKEGEKIARSITRRHRLAERLLKDVLDISELGKSACEFEHILSGEIADSICTLLGHPRLCPHNLKIPEGECCKKVRKELEPLIVSLDKMKPGESGKIAYLNVADHSELHKLLSIGVVPGKLLHLHQTIPSFVIMVENSQIALEEGLAGGIFVRRS